MEVEVTRDEDAHRYEARGGGEELGFAEYRSRPGLIAFVHTEVADAAEGQGIGSKLVSHALGDARANGDAVLPFCPFVRDYIARHPEYLDLVPADRRAHFEL